MDHIFFKSSADLRRWLEKHHARSAELWIGFYRTDSRKGGLTYHEALEEALCFGWIDGIRKKIDDVSFTNRFTPRKRGSNWSAVNIRKVEALTAEGRMHEAGLRAFRARDPRRTQQYSFEQRSVRLPRTFERLFRAEKDAWKFFTSQAPWYRRVATWWIISAKRDETRRRRLAVLIGDSRQQRRLAAVTPKTRDE